MNIVIDPESLTSIQREKLFNIYDTNAALIDIGEIGSPRYEAENELLEYLFGKEFFNNYEKILG